MTAAPGGWSTDGDGHARLTGHLQFTFEDPLSSLPETARNLLIAARESSPKRASTRSRSNR